MEKYNEGFNTFFFFFFLEIQIFVLDWIKCVDCNLNLLLKDAKNTGCPKCKSIYVEPEIPIINSLQIKFLHKSCLIFSSVVFSFHY